MQITDSPVPDHRKSSVARVVCNFGIDLIRSDSREEGELSEWIIMGDSEAWPLTSEDLKSQCKTLGTVMENHSLSETVAS